jgi:hypothetical protein
MAKRPESGAEVTALQTLTRPPGVFAPREALGVRRVYRRFSPVVHPKITLIAQILVLESKIFDYEDAPEDKDEADFS